MKSDLNDLKKLTMELMQNDNYKDVQDKNEHLIQKFTAKILPQALLKKTKFWRFLLQILMTLQSKLLMLQKNLTLLKILKKRKKHYLYTIKKLS